MSWVRRSPRAGLLVATLVVAAGGCRRSTPGKKAQGAATAQAVGGTSQPARASNALEANFGRRARLDCKGLIASLFERVQTQGRRKLSQEIERELKGQSFLVGLLVQHLANDVVDQLATRRADLLEKCEQTADHWPAGVVGCIGRGDQALACIEKIRLPAAIESCYAEAKLPLEIKACWEAGRAALEDPQVLGALTGLRRIVAGAKAYYKADHFDKNGQLRPKQFPPSAGWTPSRECCGAERDCRAARSEWQDRTWTVLKFRPNEGSRAQWRFRSSGTNKEARFVAQVRVRPGCKGQHKVFGAVGTIDAHFGVLIDAPILGIQSSARQQPVKDAERAKEDRGRRCRIVGERLFTLHANQLGNDATLQQLRSFTAFASLEGALRERFMDKWSPRCAKSPALTEEQLTCLEGLSRGTIAKSPCKALSDRAGQPTVGLPAPQQQLWWAVERIILCEDMWWRNTVPAETCRDEAKSWRTHEDPPIKITAMGASAYQVLRHRCLRRSSKLVKVTNRCIAETIRRAKIR